MKKMKAVIFDFNGTMVFDGSYHDHAWKQFSKHIRGYAFSDDEINRLVHGKVNKEIIQYLKPDLTEEENERFSLEKEAMYRELCRMDKKGYKLVNGVEEYMDYLKEHQIPFTIASASIRENMDFFFEIFELERWISKDKIVYNDGIHTNKKEMFLSASSKLQVPIEECIIFEDSFTGIQCAKEIHAGMIIAIPLKEYRNEFMEDENISFVIEDFTDIRIREVV